MRTSTISLVAIVACGLPWLALAGCSGGGDADDTCEAVTCPAGQTCEPASGACVDVCPPGLSFCDGTCADINSNAGHCGGCGNACPSGAVCASGQCLAITEGCPPGFLECGGVCVDPLTNREFCGATDCTSAVACESGFICNGAGACELSCQPGLVDCGGTCIDPNTDRAFCGANASCQGFTACGAGEICNGAGACELSCQPGLVDCGGLCVNPLTDRDFCGADAACQNFVACGVTDQCDQGVCTSISTPQIVATKIATGSQHSCVLLDTGDVRCWGAGNQGQHGYGFTQTIGDDDVPTLLGNVDIGGRAVQITGGSAHTCVLLDTGTVRCWGAGASGRLGYGNVSTIGDNETPASAGDVDVGGTVVQISAGNEHTCALLDTGAVRCWGEGTQGRLGHGSTLDIGDNETPASAGDVDVGGPVSQVVAGGLHTCALRTNGAVRCWGDAFSGQLGYGNGADIGDNETPASAGDVNLGGIAVALATHGSHTCALLTNGNLHCWGQGAFGALGYGNTSTIGDDEVPALAGPVNVGGTVVKITTGDNHTCALLANDAVRCWGLGGSGRLGYGNSTTIGDNERAGAGGDVDIADPGDTVLEVSAGGVHTCAIIDDGGVRCWGSATSGQLGYGNISTIGDNETAATAGDVPL